MAEKKEIRKQLIVERDALSPDVWSKKSNAIESSILRSRLYRDCDHLLIYADFHGEVGTTMIIEDALIKGKKVYLPKVLESFEEARMDFFQISSSFELVNGYKGIMEPLGNRDRCFDYEKNKSDHILMLVPGVSFTKDGYRLGYGKGYYDSYLTDKNNIIKCGICFSMQVVEDLPINSHDIKMDLLVTENVSFTEIDRIKF